MPQLLPYNQTPEHWIGKLDQLFEDFNCRWIAEEMQEGPGPNDVYFSIERNEIGVCSIEDIRGEHSGFQSLPILEQVISDVQEFRVKIACVKILWRGSVKNQLSYLLTYTASNVEEFLA